MSTPTAWIRLIDKWPVPESVLAQTPTEDVKRAAAEKLATRQKEEARLRSFFEAITGNDAARAVELLKAFPELSKEVGPTGLIPLHRAAEKGLNDLAGILIRSGANPNAANQRKETALHLASRYGRIEIVKLLLTNHADTGARDVDDWTPLHAAAMGHNNEKLDAESKRAVAEILVAAGAPVGATAKGGLKPVDVAEGWGYSEIARVLRG